MLKQPSFKDIKGCTSIYIYGPQHFTTQSTRTFTPSYVEIPYVAHVNCTTLAITTAERSKSHAVSLKQNRPVVYRYMESIVQQSPQIEHIDTSKSKSRNKKEKEPDRP